VVYRVCLMEFGFVAIPVHMANNHNQVLINWNVRGLNNPARRQVVREIINEHRCRIVCLQESKLQSVDDAVIGTTLGQSFTSAYAVLPAQGTCGGIIWDAPVTTTIC
jgi:hypothetical protein